MSRNPPSFTSSAVERRFRAANASGAHHAEPQRRLKVHPVIAIGGPHGAQRERIAHEVADALGFQYFNREIVRRIGAHMGTSPGMLAVLDERAIDSWSEAMAGFQVHPSVHSAEYRSELWRVVRHIAECGNAVIVGHGGRFLLDPAACLRVYLTAPLEHRIARLVEDGLAPEAASAEVRRVDADRSGFVRDYFSADPNAPSEQSDLVVNVQVLGVAGAVDTILAAYASRYLASGE